MYCVKCGEKMKDGALFCSKCGEPLDDQQGTMAQPTGGGADVRAGWVNPETVPTVKKANRKPIFIGIGVIAFCLVLAALFALSDGRSYKIASSDEGSYITVIEGYESFANTGDVTELLSLIPDECVDIFVEDVGYENKAEFIVDLQADYEYYLQDMEDYYGDNWKVTCDILDTENITGEELTELEEYYSGNGVIISAAKVVTVNITKKGSLDEDTYTEEIVVVKIGSAWYFDIYYN